MADRRVHDTQTMIMMFHTVGSISTDIAYGDVRGAQSQIDRVIAEQPEIVKDCMYTSMAMLGHFASMQGEVAEVLYEHIRAAIEGLKFYAEATEGIESILAKDPEEPTDG